MGRIGREVGRIGREEREERSLILVTLRLNVECAVGGWMYSLAPRQSAELEGRSGSSVAVKGLLSLESLRRLCKVRRKEGQGQCHEEHQRLGGVMKSFPSEGDRGAIQKSGAEPEETKK